MTTDPSSAANVAYLLARSARLWPALPALAVGAQVLRDYASFASRVARQAAAMRASGLERGDRVALCAHNHPAYLEAMFACWWAGLVAVPVNAKLHVQELAYILSDSGARWAFVDAAWEAAVSTAAMRAARRSARRTCCGPCERPE